MMNGVARGSLVVLAGPSGSGKTSLATLAMERLEQIDFSVSWTSRAPRRGETDGRDYRFVSRKRFLRAVEEGRFLEHATVHGNLYGTSMDALESALAHGRDVLLDIDVQGAEQVRQRLDGETGWEAVSVFVVPPDRDELERRLRHRRTDDEETIRTRLENSLAEISRAGEFDHILINDDLEGCYRQFAGIIAALRTRSRRMVRQLATAFSQR